MTPFAIAGIQMQVSADKPNVTAMQHKLDRLMAIFPWVQMVLFSELAACGPIPRHPEALPNGAEVEFQEMAARHGIWLIPGSQFELAEEKLYNTASVIAPDGSIVSRYRKMFPFRPYEAGVEGGSEFCIFDVPEVGRFGLSICYDMWFPETTRTLTAMGAEVILHPVLTGTIDREIEIAIARSSAAMFQCYIFDINGLGYGGNGGSCVFDPTGTPLHQAMGQEAFLPLEIDLDQVRRQRETGLRGLGQPLKSFRDRAVDFSVYQAGGIDDSYLQSLGPLVMPERGSKAGLKETVVPPQGAPTEVLREVVADAPEEPAIEPTAAPEPTENEAVKVQASAVSAGEAGDVAPILAAPQTLNF